MAEMSNKVQISSLEMSSETQSSSLEVSKSSQSSSCEQSTEVQTSSASRSSCSQISSVKESTNLSNAVLSAGEGEGVSVADMSSVERPGLSITGINPLKNMEEFQQRFTESGNGGTEFSTSNVVTQKKVSSCSSKMTSTDGGPPVTEVTENTSEELLSESRTNKIVDGETVIDEGASCVQMEDTKRLLTKQGEQVSETELVSSQAAEVMLKNGDAVSSSFVENVSFKEDEAEFPPPPVDLDDFPPPPKEEDLPPTDAPDSSPDCRSSYVTLVTPSGFVSPTRDENDANRRNFANSLLSDRTPDDVDSSPSLPDHA